MERLSAEEELLLERVWLGELDPASVAVQRRAQANPAVAEALRDWHELCARMEACRDEDRRLVEQALASASAEDRVRIARTLRHVPPRQLRARILGWFGLLVAAALLVFVGWRVLDDRKAGPSPTGFLGAEGSVAPLGSVPSLALFTVEASHPAWRTLRIAVYDLEGRELLASPILEEARWQPTDTELEVLRRAGPIEWEYELLDGAGAVCASGGPFRAWLSD